MRRAGIFATMKTTILDGLKRVGARYARKAISYQGDHYNDRGTTSG